MPGRRSRAGRAAALVVPLAVLISCGTAAIAHATMDTTTAASSATWGTLTVTPATGLGATTACGPVGSHAAQASLTWTVSTTTRLTSQSVLRRTGSTGSFTVVATLSTTASSYVDSSLAVATTYNYEIRSAVNGFAADTAPVVALTPALCL